MHDTTYQRIEPKIYIASANEDEVIIKCRNRDNGKKLNAQIISDYEIVNRLREELKHIKYKNKCYTPDNWDNNTLTQLTQYELQVIIITKLDEIIQSILGDRND